MTDTNLLLSEVEAFLKDSPLSATRFGLDAVGDRNFVHQLRAGRRCWPETVLKVRKFIQKGGKLAASEEAA